MTVASELNRVVYTGNGVTTAFAVSFPFQSPSNLIVIETVIATGVQTTKTLTTHYTVSGTTDSLGYYPNGGTVTAVVAPAATVRWTIYRAPSMIQSLNLSENNALPAESLEAQLDYQTMLVQRLADQISRTARQPDGDSSNIGTLPAAVERAHKVLAFDSAGEPIAATEIGNWRGNWATSTAYIVRDLVKDASNANVYRCLTAHTSTGTTPISSNADVAKWALVVDAASANTSATNAAASALLSSQWASQTSGIVDGTDYASKAWAVGGTNVTNTATRGAAKEWATKTSSTVDTTEFSSKEYAQGTQAATGGSAKNWAQQTGADVTGASANSRSSKSWAQENLAGATLGGSAKDWAQSASLPDGTNKSAKSYAADAQSSASTASSAAATATTQAGNAAASALSAQAAQTAAEAAYHALDNNYLGAKSSDPTLDNQGLALNTGDLYFNTTLNRMKVYNGASWDLVALDPTTVVGKTSGTGSAQLPVGTTAQRDGTPSAGYLRYNSSLTQFEGYNGSSWGSVGGGATGGGNDQVFVLNDQTVTTSYVISASKNAMTTGPLSVNSGVSVTVSSGSRWIII